jgi:magnesium transporter
MLRAYRFHQDRLHATDVDVSAPHATAEGAVWLDLLNPTRAEDVFVESLLGISIPTREEAEDIEVSARLYHEGGAEFMTMTALAHVDGDEPITTPITFILAEDVLVTVRYDEPKPFTTYATRAQRAGAVDCMLAEHVMLGLVEALIERIAEALGEVGRSLEQMSRGVFRHKAKGGSKSRDFQSVIEKLGAQGDLLAMIRESLVSVNRLLSYHTASERTAEAAGKHAAAWTTDMQQDVAALSDHASYLFNKTSFQLDATLGLINLEQNQIIKIFSIAAVCLMPPTLVASIYGMNFEHMPELEWRLGYPWAVTLMVVSAIIPMAWFKRKGWF